jgi:hypothetical protein
VRVGGGRQERLLDHGLEGLDPEEVGIEARDEVEVGATGVEETFATADADFLEGFEAIADEGGADDAERAGT